MEISGGDDVHCTILLYSNIVLYCPTQHKLHWSSAEVGLYLFWFTNQAFRNFYLSIGFVL